MYPDWVWWLLPMAIFVWLAILSFLTWQQIKFLVLLFPKGSERDIRKKFEEVFKAVTDYRGELAKIEEKLSQLENHGLAHIQRVKLLRFNPYQETGGDQSFSIALLDEKGNGIVLTSLHARSGTRVFAKPVKMGRGVRYQLSSEEEEVLRKAMTDE